jgi:hypothetical protein
MLLSRRMQRVSNIAMATLIVAALFFGNCLSCPQMLLAMAGQHPGHGCCHHPAPKIDCHSQSLSHFVKAQGQAAPALVASGVVRAIGTAAMPALCVVAPLHAADVPPPDLLSRHSLLRV